MPDTSDLSKLDRRTIERYLRDGTIDEKAYEKFLKSIPDSADKSATIETQMFDDEGEDGSDDEGDEDNADE